MSIKSIILPEFATKDWFRTYQLPLKFAINHPRPVKREYYRDKLGLIHLDPRISISNITPNAAHYRVEKDQVQAVIYSGNVFEWALKREFEKIFYPLHKFDLQIANRFIPVLNLGYDTLTVYSTIADGYVRHTTSSTWTTTHDATTGTSSATSNTAYYIAESGWGGSSFNITRAFYYFDTTISGSPTISSAVLSIKGWVYSSASVCVMKGTQSNSLTTADYAAFSGNSYASKTSWSTSGYNDFTLNSTGISDLNLGGVTKYCARNYLQDYNNSSPGTSSYASGGYYADQTDVTSDPKLVITYTPASAVGARSGGVV